MLFIIILLLHLLIHINRCLPSHFRTAKMDTYQIQMAGEKKLWSCALNARARGVESDLLLLIIWQLHYHQKDKSHAPTCAWQAITEANNQ